MTRELVTRADGKTIDLPKEEAEQADQTAKAKKVLLVDATGTAISAINKLPVSAALNVEGDIEIGAVEIKNATDDTRAVVKSDGTNNALVVTQNVQPLPSGASTSGNQATIIQNLETLNSLVPSVYDYISLEYTDGNLTTATYKLGGSEGTTVSTLTLAYTDGNLVSVTKS